MKKIYLFLIGIMFCGVMTAQSQRFADDILLHECDGVFWAKPKISVDDNGWIYVLKNQYGDLTVKDSITIYCSKDGGVSFEKIFNSNFILDKRQAGLDLVVTGNDPSNIILWLAYACNDEVTGEAVLALLKFDAYASSNSEVYQNVYPGTTAKDVAISTNARSPESGWAPFAIGFALSYNTGSDGHIDYVYSTDGGATFTKKGMYTKANSEFGAIDLSIGQATAADYYPKAGIVFEMDKESEENIGFIAAVADGNFATDALQVNKKFSATDKTMQPKIQWLCNNELDELYNFIIVYSNYTEGVDWDIVQIVPTAAYDLSNHTLNNLESGYAVAYHNTNEDYADLSFDKNYNNYLLVCRQSDDNKSVLKYYVRYYTEITSWNWDYVDDVSIVSTNWESYFSPVVDIDPTRTQACFAFEYYNSSEGVAKMFFDSEWSVGIENHEIVAKDMSVYPNPASNFINVISENANELITISDLSGKVVYSEQASEKQSVINISQLSAGMYIVRIGDKATKFVKE